LGSRCYRWINDPAFAVEDAGGYRILFAVERRCMRIAELAGG